MFSKLFWLSVEIYVDWWIIIFKRKNQASKKKDNKKKATEQVTLLSLSSKRQHCFVLKYLKIQMSCSTDYYFEPGKGFTKNNFKCYLYFLNIKIIFYRYIICTCMPTSPEEEIHATIQISISIVVKYLLSCFYFVTSTFRWYVGWDAICLALFTPNLFRDFHQTTLF